MMREELEDWTKNDFPGALWEENPTPISYLPVLLKKYTTFAFSVFCLQAKELDKKVCWFPFDISSKALESTSTTDIDVGRKATGKRIAE